MLIILDVDGTLVEGTKSTTVRPHMLELCRESRDKGHRLAIATNQAGVSLGYVTYEETLGRISWIASQIGAERFVMSLWHQNAITRFAHCPEIGCAFDPFFRKPEPGMLLWLMQAMSSYPKDTIYVGDMNSDRYAAERAGIKFERETEWGGR